MFIQRLTNWIESHWVTPAYSGWVLLGIAVFFFGAATNTMAGWLYVISGVMMAMLSVGSMMPQQALKGLTAHRQSIGPISAGESLLVEVTVKNETRRPKSLLQLRDYIAPGLGSRQEVAISTIAPQDRYTWFYEVPTQRRGIYRWQSLHLRTGAPLGLFWCSREQVTPAKAVVYPQILPLTHCAILDLLGSEAGLQWQRDQTANAGNEGLTRALRPYRWGDATRLIHWRTSARYGELRVRELEKFTSSQDITIALDTYPGWNPDQFEQAVITAASLYVYAQKQGISSQFWSPVTGTVKGQTAVLTTLAGIATGQPDKPLTYPQQSLLWISSTSSNNPSKLPASSRIMRFLTQTAAHSGPDTAKEANTLIIDSQDDLQRQLQQAS